jgi:hypothetical protein
MVEITPGGDNQPLDLTQFSKIEFVVNPSMIRPIIGTLVALFAFGSAFMLSVVKYLSAADFIGLWVFIQQQDTLAGLAQLSAAAVIGWRWWAARKRKLRENRLVDTSSVAMKTTDPVAVPVISATPEPDYAIVPAGKVDLRAVAREAATPATPAPSPYVGFPS